MTESNHHNTHTKAKVGLVLTGGGARAAFQVGALRAISDIFYEHKTDKQSENKNPYPIITGTSAGAINATVLAAYARYPRIGVKKLEQVWRNFSVEQIFRSDFRGVMQNTGRWTRAIFSTRYYQKSGLGLFNNEPLKKLLSQVIHYGNIQKSIDSGHLDALSITASGYNSKQSISFFQAKANTKEWQRYHRRGVATRINREHLLASSAIPLIFPAVKINGEFYGDGSVRFLTPLSPAIHLGADKVLVIGLEPERKTTDNKNIHQYPSIGDIAGHVLDSVFIDSLNSDLERINRINDTIKLIPESVRQTASKLRPIETLTISPSQDISELASQYFSELPRLIQFFFKRLGIDDNEGSTVLSYLLFESAYTSTLIELGYQDTIKQKKNIELFFNL